MKTEFEIGQKVWWATCTTESAYETCPHCGGSGRLRVIFHDDTEVSIECNNCQSGYDPPTGRVRIHQRTPRATRVEITGIEIKKGGAVEYRANSSNIANEERLFDTYDEAMAAAEVMVKEMDASEREKAFWKEHPTRTWAFNASYHRREIKRHREQIAYHESKLAVADLRAREQKEKKRS